jgi:hypothetical protein
MPVITAYTYCAACGKLLVPGDKAGHFSMRCYCTHKPCSHPLICNACGVFFADETVKRREDPARGDGYRHTHTPTSKKNCKACRNARYRGCIRAHMNPNRVGPRAKRKYLREAWRLEKAREGLRLLLRAAQEIENTAAK